MAATLPKVYPFVRSIRTPDRLIVGPWPDGGPLGCTVHHSADDDLERVVAEGQRAGVGYHLIVDRAGKVHQTAWLDGRIHHAGKARWDGRSPNSCHVAVCILSWGRLRQSDDGRLLSWTKAVVPQAEARWDNDAFGRPAWWHAATERQEKAVLEVLTLLIAAGVDPGQIAGHDEVAIPAGRKDDPGGVLSLPMARIRREFIERGRTWWAR